jgi:hypothetical protein
MSRLSLAAAIVAMAACSSSQPASSSSTSSTAPISQAPQAAQTAPADAPPPETKPVNSSPYPTKTFPDRVYWGDTHLHTAYSTDAGMIGCVLGPEEAYRFARGEAVKSSHGTPAQLQRPYDFLVVSDHAENLGLAPLIAESNPELLKSEWGKKVHDLVKAGKGFEAYNVWGGVLARQDPRHRARHLAAAWQRITGGREYNEPGHSRPSSASEWSAGPNGNNLHRNILFRDGKDKATDHSVVVLRPTIRTTGNWMADYENKTGGRRWRFRTTAICRTA